MKKLFAPVILIVIACSALSAQDVSRTYAANCANCHGADGRGNTVLGQTLKLRDLSSAELKKFSDRELAAIIGKGMDRGRMPGFEKKLGTEMVVQLASYVHNIDSQPAVPQVKNEKAELKSEPSDAKNVYAAKCAHCHGADGSGNTILGRRMELRDMRSREAQQYSDTQLAAVVANGMDRGRMPGFEKKLGPEAVQQLASYVRVLMGGSPLVATDRMVRGAATPSMPASSASLALGAQLQHPAMSEVQADIPAEVHESKPAPVAKTSRLAKLSSAIIPGAKNAPATEVVDLNSASKETLMTLPGITESDALRIIDGRPYKSSLQFKTRNIIAPEKYAQIADRVIAKQPARAARSSTAAERTQQVIGAAVGGLLHY